MPSDPISGYVEFMRTRGLSATLIRRRASILRAAERVMGKPLLRAKSDDVTRLVAQGRHRGLADATLYVYTGHLRAFYEWARRAGLTSRNPTDAAARPRRPRYLPRPIANGPLGMAIETADARTRIVLMLAALAGLRAIEIARLRREDILDHVDTPVLLVHGKGDKPRTVPMSDLLVAELHRYGLPKRGPVIRRADGLPAPVSASLVSSIANRHLHDLGISDTLHSLRHYAATELYRQTKDIRMVGDILGHASPATTAIYTLWASEDAPAAMKGLAEKVLGAEDVHEPKANGEPTATESDPCR